MIQAYSISFPIDDYIPKTIEEVISMVKLNAKGITAISTCGLVVNDDQVKDLFVSLQNNNHINIMSFYGMWREGHPFISEEIGSIISNILQSGRYIKEIDLGYCHMNENTTNMIISSLKNANVSKIYLDNNTISTTSWEMLLDIVREKHLELVVDKDSMTMDIYTKILTDPTLSNISFTCHQKHFGNFPCKTQYELAYDLMEEEVDLLGNYDTDTL